MPNTIKENELIAVEEFVKLTNPTLAETLRGIRETGDWTDLPTTHKGQSIKRIFTPALPIPANHAHAILEDLKKLSKTQGAHLLNFNDLSIHGAYNAWHNFIT